MNQPVRIIIAGTGDRGSTYAKYAESFPEEVNVVGIAEPRDHIRQRIGDLHNVAEENRFLDWADMVKAPKFADAVIISLQDALHVDAAIAFADKGYHILLEKPMATSLEDCYRIIEAVKRNNIIFSVCHVLRYTSYTKALKKLLDSKVIGNIVTIDHIEPVGFWHQAHSFVRGNWGNTDRSTFMLLAKSCHDLDWLRYVIGKPCRSVVSFGGLKYFKEENRPANGGERCLSCEAEPTCPYSARRIYFRFYEQGLRGWPLTVLTQDVTAENITHELKTGPYGKCVFLCDNDVVDHQTVMLKFDDDITANFTMTAFTPSTGRKTHICGTKGYIYGDSKTITVHDFLSDKSTEIDPQKDDNEVLNGHGGGDNGVMKNFVEAVAKNDPSIILTGPDVTLESHEMVFLAEKSRLTSEIQHFKRD